MNRLSHPTPPTPYLIPHFNRRGFLTGAIGITLGNLLMGCSGSDRQTLSLHVLNGSIPPQLVGAFRKYLQQTATVGGVEVAIEPQLAQLFELLQTWKRKGQVNASTSSWFSQIPFIGKRGSAAVPDLVTLGDYWLEKAIQQELIQPLDPTQWQGWEQLPHEWKALVTRSASAKTPDRVWGAPYRWGSTVIAYRQDLFKEKGLQPPTDWSDLWRSDLRGHISLLDQPREVIGLTLKKLGQSYNTTNLQAVPQLKAELTALNQQVKLYSSDSYLQPLLLGDTWLAVGWSTDILPLTQRNQTIAAVVPKAGTALWAELWVRPAAAKPELSSLVAAWIGFCWRSEIASQLSLLSRAASPAVLETAPANLPVALRQNSVLLPDVAIRQASEFLKPLDRTTADEYQALWQHLRQVVG